MSDPWVLTWTDPNDPTPALLWNGLIGVRIGRDGAGWDPASKVLPFFMIDEYERSGEENIAPLANPLGIRWRVGGTQLTPSAAKEYGQALDMRTGVLTTTWMQETQSGRVTIQNSSVIHPDVRTIAQSWVVTPERGLDLSFESSLISDDPSAPIAEATLGFEESDFDSGRFGTQARLSHHVSGAGGSTRLKGFTWTWSGRVDAGSSVKLRRVFSMGSSQTATGTDTAPPPNIGFGEAEAASRAAWKDRWKTDIEIDGPIEDQQAIRSFLFYLRSAIHPAGGMSISPFGLSNQLYNGHVFWDADMWVFPALAFIYPSAAKAISDYRQRLVDGTPSNIYANFGLSRGLQVPWESSVSGREVAPLKFRRQLHVTGGALWMLAQSAALGLVGTDKVGLAGWESVYSFGTQASFLYYHLSSSGPDGKRRMRNVMSVDENHIGDNDLYTNLLAQWVINGLSFDGVTKFALPRDDKTFLTYDNDPLRAYNQAAAVLAIFPLQYPPAEREARQMMDRFADKIAENGPAMSDSIHATIWARMGETDKAYETWRKSWQKYTNHPLMLFSERPKSGQTYFTTGAAGCLNAVIYGFLGFRIDEKKQPGAVWSKQLLGARWLSIKPNLPKAWKSVKFKNFKVLGKSYTLTVTRKRASVTQGER